MKKALENTVEKGENAGNQHFLLFPLCFLLYENTKIIILAMLKLSSANAFNLVMSKILSFGKVLSPPFARACLIFLTTKMMKAFDNLLGNYSVLLQTQNIALFRLLICGNVTVLSISHTTILFNFPL